MGDFTEKPHEIGDRWIDVPWNYQKPVTRKILEAACLRCSPVRILCSFLWEILTPTVLGEGGISFSKSIVGKSKEFGILL